MHVGHVPGAAHRACVCEWLPQYPCSHLRSVGHGVLSREGLECLGSQFRKSSEVRQHYTVPKVSPRLDMAKPILRVFVGKQALEMWVVVPVHALGCQEHQRQCPQACGHNYAAIHSSAVLVGKYFPQQLHSLLPVDFGPSPSSSFETSFIKASTLRWGSLAVGLKRFNCHL